MVGHSGPIVSIEATEERIVSTSFDGSLSSTDWSFGKKAARATAYIGVPKNGRASEYVCGLHGRASGHRLYALGVVARRNVAENMFSHRWTRPPASSGRGGRADEQARSSAAAVALDMRHLREFVVVASMRT